MRGCVLVVVCAVVASCGKKSEPAPAGKLIEQMPRVDDVAALAPAGIELPRVVAFLAPDGTMTANDRATSWDTFLKQDPRRKAIPVDAAHLASLVHAADDDPPPPPPAPPEEDQDDGEAESGGVGTMPLLDEGKMKKRDYDRAEGQYRMVEPKTPEVLRQEALERAGVAGFLPVLSSDAPSGFAIQASQPKRKGPVPPELPRRLGKLLGETLEAPLPARLPRLLVVAAPSAKATALVDVLRENPALLAVAHQGTVRALRIGFLQQGEVRWEPDWQPWMEVRVTGSGVEVEGVPGAPVALAAFDARALADAFTKERGSRGISDRTDVDVLVASDVDAQRFVDVLVALDGAGARIYSIGRLPAAGDPELAKRGKRVATVQLRAIQSVGDLAKPVIVDTLAGVYPQVKDCYTAGLATKPELAGVVSTQFFIAPDGKVVTSNAVGVDGEVATCIAGVIKRLEFPKPSGGGGVQVNAPFILRR